MPEFSPLKENVRADVCVVGAGMAGLMTAYLLAREGRAVVVLDDGPIVSGETERTTAHLSNAMDDRFTVLERIHGVEGARLAAESHGAAIDLIERIAREERIACDFARVDGYLFNAPGQPARQLEQELAAAQRAGLHDVELVDRAPLVSYDTGPALLFPRQAQFHPLAFLSAIAGLIVRFGGRIYTESHAERVSGGHHALVTTDLGYQVDCGSIVVATNSPVNDRVTIHTKQRPYRTYVVGIGVPAGTVPTVLYWDTADPYHYVRLQASSTARGGRNVLIVGGEDHLTGQAEDTEARFARLERWARERFPMAGEVRFRWSGQVMEPSDGLAFIGHNPRDEENVYIATGDSGQGMTHGTIAGLILTDLIQGRGNRWAELYDPSRLETSAPRAFVRDNVNMASQYVDWLTPGDGASIEHLAPGQGTVVRRGFAKVAVFRDESGMLHECSAVCPHLQGIVRWNGTEQTWDCPVHGSRFDPLGHVLNGPANTDLAPLHVRSGSG